METRLRPTILFFAVLNMLKLYKLRLQEFRNGSSSNLEQFEQPDLSGEIPDIFQKVVIV